MSTLPPKNAVREALFASMERALDAMVAAAKETREGATHEENRAEGTKDMRSTEQSYLARGQAMRAEELSEQLDRLRRMETHDYGDDDAIASDALVLVSVDDEPRVFYVVPFGGGTVLEVAGVRVTVLTPTSPVGRALVGQRVGDDFEQRVRGALREWVVEAVA